MPRGRLAAARRRAAPIRPIAVAFPRGFASVPAPLAVAGIALPITPAAGSSPMDGGRGNLPSFHQVSATPADVVRQFELARVGAATPCRRVPPRGGWSAEARDPGPGRATVAA